MVCACERATNQNSAADKPKRPHFNSDSDSDHSTKPNEFTTATTQFISHVPIAGIRCAWQPLDAPGRSGAHKYVCLDVLVPSEDDDPYGLREAEDEDPYGLRFDDDDDPYGLRLEDDDADP
jgi:hypothetical protein